MANIRPVRSVESATRQRDLMEALQARALQGNAPAAGGPVQAAYSPAAALTDLASSLAAAYGVRRANKNLESAQGAENQARAEALRNFQASVPDAQVGAVARENILAAPDGELPQTVTPRSEATAGLASAFGPELQNQMSLAMMQQSLGPDPNALLAADVTRRGQDLSAEEARSREAGLNTRHGVASGDTRAREEGENKRWSTPSGNAQLGAQTTREGHGITQRGQDLDYQTTIRGQDVAMRGQDMDSATAQAKIDAEQAAAALKGNQQRAGQQSAVNRTLVAVEEALGLTNWRTAGLPGALTRSLPGGGAGTDAHSLAKTADTIKANLSFQELARMRAESPTGGALGNVTERELDLLGATVANLDPNQDDAQLRKNLEKVRQHLQNIAEFQSMAAPQAGPANQLDGDMQRYLPGVSIP